MSKVIGITSPGSSTLKIKSTSKVSSDIIDGRRPNKSKKLSITEESSTTCVQIDKSTDTSSVAVNTAGKVGLTGSRGDTGFTGSQGIQGSSVDVKGSVETAALLPIPYDGNIGDGFITKDDGNIHVWDGTAWNDLGPVRGEAGPIGFTGSQGNIGFTGSQGFDGSDGLQGETGFTGSQGEAGLAGFTGSQGIVGFTGSSGSTNLVFTEDENVAILTNYKSNDGDLFTVRTTEITNNGTFILNLAGFTPILSASVLPATTLNWDVPATGFTVTIENPTDFTDRYISSVKAINQTAGSVSVDLETFITAGPNVTPDGGVTWQQTFTVDNDKSFIRSVSSSIAGGSAGANVVFNETSAITNEEIEFTDETANWLVTWRTPTLSASIANLNGNNFLQTYVSANYTISVTGISNNQSFQHSIEGSNATASNLSGNGILTFEEPIHKDNVGIGRSLTVSTVFTRPQEVTGTSYSVTLTVNSNNVVANFTYPSFSIFTSSVAEPPTREMIVDGSNFSGDVNVLANSIRTFSEFVNNSGTAPIVFWFGVRGAAAQPTTFRTGASAALLSDVIPTVTLIELAPDVIPTGYLNEEFYLYGIILQPGSTFISIG